MKVLQYSLRPNFLYILVPNYGTYDNFDNWHLISIPYLWRMQMINSDKKNDIIQYSIASFSNVGLDVWSWSMSKLWIPQFSHTDRIKFVLPSFSSHFAFGQYLAHPFLLLMTPNFPLLSWHVGSNMPSLSQSLNWTRWLSPTHQPSGIAQTVKVRRRELDSFILKKI